MVDTALSIGPVVGILLSGGFVWWQVGRYAAPQVDETRFDERKEIFAYTAGLFVGIPLVIPLLFLFFQAIPPFAIGGIALYLALLVGGSELAQWLLLRSVYFGRDGCGPFYVLGFRAGIAGLFVLGLVAFYLSGSSVTALGVLGILAISLAIVGVEVLAGLLALPDRADRPGRKTGPLSAVPLEAIGFLALGFASSSGWETAVLGGFLIGAGTAWLYRSVGDPNLSKVRPPGRPARDVGATPSEFGRTDRPGSPEAPRPP